MGSYGHGCTCARQKEKRHGTSGLRQDRAGAVAPDPRRHPAGNTGGRSGDLCRHAHLSSHEPDLRLGADAGRLDPEPRPGVHLLAEPGGRVRRSRDEPPGAATGDRALRSRRDRRGPGAQGERPGEAQHLAGRRHRDDVEPRRGGLPQQRRGREHVHGAAGAPAPPGRSRVAGPDHGDEGGGRAPQPGVAQHADQPRPRAPAGPGRRSRHRGAAHRPGHAHQIGGRRGRRDAGPGARP